jgi:hypothetical protein
VREAVNCNAVLGRQLALDFECGMSVAYIQLRVWPEITDFSIAQLSALLGGHRIQDSHILRIYMAVCTTAVACQL